MRIVITPGEPAGIGPEIVVRYAQRSASDLFPVDNSDAYSWVVVASAALLEQTASMLGLPLKIVPFEPNETVAHQPGQLCVLDTALRAEVTPGSLNVANAHYVMDTLSTAVKGCREGLFNALVTGPVQKSVINDAGISFSGHTEFLAEQSETPRVVMMLATEGLRVALATTHLPLCQVSDAITRDSLREVIQILHRDLVNKFGLAKPRILVCGLNPHAGEGGHLGMEEIDVINPVLDELRQAGLDLVGALPADTLFTPHHLENADAVLAMYHDQGLPVLKYRGFGQAVNITLGLPFIRTSVDHGTALDLAGQGVADIGSFHTAMQAAVEMCSATAEHG